MVHYYFPPLGGIGSLRAARFASWLPDFGWEPTVVAPRNGSYHRDTTLSAGDTTVARTFSAELSRVGKRVLYGERDDVEPARVGRLGSWLRDSVRSRLYRPDAQVGWYPFAVRAGRHLLHEQRFEAVHSSSSPITAHLVARCLAREARVPWVAEFRDPWADVKLPLDPYRSAADRLERELLREADAVVTVSPTLEACWRAKGARRTQVITNGFDPSPKMEDLAPSDFVLTYAGSYYPHMQDLASLWPAVRAFQREHPRERVRIRFVGDIPPSLRGDIEANGLGSVLEVTGFLPHGQVVEALKRSSTLVVAGTSRSHPIYDCLLPAKMFEYLGTGRPVLYVGERATDAGRFLGSQPGCWLVGTGDVATASDALRAIRSGPRLYDRDLGSYTRRELTRELANLLDDVVTAHANGR
jgi:glycosyltransferase involved in cell wall biosynthesis